VSNCVEGRERVAVVGSGVSGLTAAYLLQGRYSVTLYEEAARLGGHADTHNVQSDDAGELCVDTGFIVYNEATYPFLTKLLAELEVATQPTDMSMSIQCKGCGLQYAGGRGLGGVLAQPRSLLRPSFLSMLWEIRRFNRLASAEIKQDEDERTLADFLAEHGFSAYFIRHYVIPVVSCVWSSGTTESLKYPARYLFVFLDNHGMLSIRRSPRWRTIRGGSRTYVDRIAQRLDVVKVNTPVRSVTRDEGYITIRDGRGDEARFERVVIATHADTALGLLADSSVVEKEILGAFDYSQNDTVLHADATILPRAPRARASWNFLASGCHAVDERVVVTYDMNRLQALPTSTPMLVTLNAEGRVARDQIRASMRYAHPIFTLESVAAQRRLHELGDDRLVFAGAYHGWGFHEDGCRSGVAAAAALGASW
jgi:predicted NAD/FAD-binding protein